MTKINSLEDLIRVKEEAIKKQNLRQAARSIQVIIGMGSTGIAAGAYETLKVILEVVEKERMNNVTVRQTGNIGMDSLEPIVQVVIGEEPRITYGKVTPDIAVRILLEHVKNGKVITDHVVEGQY
jgi:NADP-reducing hydrogenase subunit HndB